MSLKITIPVDEYLSLLEDSEVLLRLQGGGVDNWSWYGESIHGEDQQDLDEWNEETKERVLKLAFS